MINKILKWFSKNEEAEVHAHLAESEEAKFLLKVDNIKIGTLYCDKGEWIFEYSYNFKNNTDKYNRITGFPDLNKTYHSEILWPFFQVRIPGLKQPEIQEILNKEKIDQYNEVALLKRFGQKTISNPYQLVEG